MPHRNPKIFLKINYSESHPASLLSHPRGHIPLEYEAHGLHQAEEVLRVAHTHAVDGEAARDAVEAHDLAPADVGLEHLAGDGAEDVAHGLLAGDGDGDLRWEEGGYIVN